MRVRILGLVFILLAALLGGCGNTTSVPTAGATDSAAEEGAPPDSSRLAMGMLRLEGSANAVTPEQARALLPLWQALQSGTLQNDAETAAVLKQIQGALSAEQLAAVEAMQLTAPGNGAQGLGPSSAPLGGDPGSLGEEELAAMRATAEAGGGMPGGGGAFGSPGNMSEEERAAMLATAEAGGMAPGGGQGPRGVGGGRGATIAAQVIELLTARAAE